MSAPILATKLYIPPLRENVVSRPHLVARLDEGLRRKLTLISAPAGWSFRSRILHSEARGRKEGNLRGRCMNMRTRFGLRRASLELEVDELAFLEDAEQHADDQHAGGDIDAPVTVNGEGVRQQLAGREVVRGLSRCRAPREGPAPQASSRSVPRCR